MFVTEEIINKFNLFKKTSIGRAICQDLINEIGIIYFSQMVINPNIQHDKIDSVKKYLNQLSIHLIQTDNPEINKLINNFMANYDENYDFEKIMTLLLNDDLLQIDKIKNGDLIEFVNQSGYRSEGLFMLKRTKYKEIDKIELVDLESEYDDYGSPNCFFKFPYFSPVSWMIDNLQHIRSKPSSINDELDIKSKAYWHSLYPPVCVDQSIKDKISWFGIDDIPLYGIYKNYAIVLSMEEIEDQLDIDNLDWSMLKIIKNKDIDLMVVAHLDDDDLRDDPYVSSIYNYMKGLDNIYSVIRGN
jgi:hypothetical protein